MSDPREVVVQGEEDESCPMAAPFTDAGEDQGEVCWHPDEDSMMPCDGLYAPDWCRLRKAPVLIRLAHATDSSEEEST